MGTHETRHCRIQRLGGGWTHPQQFIGALPQHSIPLRPVGVTFEDGATANKMRLQQAFTVCIDQLRPQSRGEIRLQSSDVKVKPSLHFNYLSTEHDRREIVEGVMSAQELVRQRAFDAYRGKSLDAMEGAKTPSASCAPSAP